MGPVPCSKSLSLNWRLLVPLKWNLFEFKSTTKKKKLEQVDIVSPVSAQESHVVHTTAAIITHILAGKLKLEIVNIV